MNFFQIYRVQPLFCSHLLLLFLFAHQRKKEKKELPSSTFSFSLFFRDSYFFTTWPEFSTADFHVQLLVFDQNLAKQLMVVMYNSLV